ncbi:MAG: glutathione S-transferase family protein [Pseudomonadota bacterium]
MADYRLYYLPQSGNCYKVALMLALTDSDWEPHYIDMFGGATRAPEFLALNSMGELPVLEHGQTVLTQSAMILLYLAEQTGQFGGTTDAERREILRWLFWDNHKGSTQMATTRFNHNFIPEDKRSADVSDFLTARTRGGLKVLNRQLKGRDWVAADRPTIADLSIAGYLFYPEPFGYDAESFPNVAAWLDRLKALPGWQAPYDLMKAP